VAASFVEPRQLFIDGGAPDAGYAPSRASRRRGRPESGRGIFDRRAPFSSIERRSWELEALGGRPGGVLPRGVGLLHQQCDSSSQRSVWGPPALVAARAPTARRWVGQQSAQDAPCLEIEHQKRTLRGSAKTVRAKARHGLDLVGTTLPTFGGPWSLRQAGRA